MKDSNYESKNDNVIDKGEEKGSSYLKETKTKREGSLRPFCVKFLLLLSLHLSESNKGHEWTRSGRWTRNNDETKG